MKKIFLLIITLFIFNSCTTNDVKEISGTLIFNDFGSHIFNINADNIEATIIMVGPNNGESIILQNVSLYRTVDYNAKIGINVSKSLKTELLSNLVVMYEVESGQSLPNDFKNRTDSGYIKIDWKGIN